MRWCEAFYLGKVSDEECERLDRLHQVLKGGMRDGEAVVRGGAAAELVKNDQAGLSGLRQPPWTSPTALPRRCCGPAPDCRSRPCVCDCVDGAQPDGLRRHQ